MLNKGDIAPDFTLDNQEFMPVSLSDYDGDWRILYFYPKDNTSGCTKEACDFTEKVGEFADLDAVIIGISTDSPESHEKFIAKHNLDIELLSDPNKQVMKLYGAWGLKKNYGKEYEGVIRTTFLIAPDGTIAEIWNKVRVRVKTKNGETRHVDKVMERLQELINKNE